MQSHKPRMIELAREPDFSPVQLKIIRLTPTGERIRERIVRDMSAPPPEIAGLPLAHQRALREAVGRLEPAGVPSGA